MNTSPNKMMRRADVLSLVGFGNTALYARIGAGEFPPPVSLGGTLVAWSSREVDAWIAARLAGATDEEVRTLVRKLVAERGQAETVATAQSIANHPRFSGQKLYWEAVRRGEKKMPRESDEAFEKRRAAILDNAPVSTQPLAA